MTSTDPAQPAPSEAEQQQKLHKDPVTGEMISKTELKRREKQRKTAEEKAKKAEKAPAAAKAGKPKEEELTPNVSLLIPAYYIAFSSRPLMSSHISS